jgi:hypothetical protein
MTPDMSRRQIEDRVRRIIWSEPSSGLRDRVLSAAVVVAQPVSWSDRVWFSRAWRLSAVAATLAIVLLDQLSGTQRQTDFTPAPQTLAEARAIDETGRQLGLPPDVAESLARRFISDAARPPAHPRSSSELLQAFELDSAGGDR